MTRLFREVEIVNGESTEPVDYAGIHTACCPSMSGCWCVISPSGSPEVGFVEVDYTTEDVEKLQKAVKQQEDLLSMLRMVMLDRAGY